MEKLLPIGMFIVGIFIGGVLAWFILRPKLQEAKNQGRAEVESERATLMERLQGREEQLKESRDSLK